MSKIKKVLKYVAIAGYLVVAWKYSQTTSPVFASQSQVIQATIKLAVCGDGVQEFPEECDRLDLAAQTCISQGFEAGSIQCDIACGLDTTACYGSAPTLLTPPASTPSPASSVLPTTTPQVSDSARPTPVSLPSSENSSANSINITPSPIPFPHVLPTSFSFDVIVKPAVLPVAMRPYDIDGSGIIEEQEIEDSVTLWVGEWHLYIEQVVDSNSTRKSSKPGCDLNADNSCNLVDFSILMYYLGKKE